MKKKPVLLIILDGFGHEKPSASNAITQAHTPNLDAWFLCYPHTLLQASGAAVGLLPGYAGNSEVGHMTIGTGRIIEQPITRINKAIEDKTFFRNPTLVKNLKTLKERGGALHIMGLVSDGGVHSDLAHLYAYLDAAHQQGIKYVYVHAFLDGRDSPPQSAQRYLKHLDQALTMFEFGSLGSIHGRYYAMDRDGNWDRTEKSYRVLTETSDTPAHWQDVIQQQYAQGLTDEFIVPTQLDPTSTVQPGDGIIFFNVRPDRARQLTATFVNPSFNHFHIKKLPLTFFITPVSYASFLPTQLLYQAPAITHTLKEVLAEHDKRIFSIAETEKYAHITYFFNGLKEEPVAHETRVLIPSIKTRDYIQHPAMSALAITDAVLSALHENLYDFYLINYANADMVGHSGNIAATIKAIECLDRELKRLYDSAIEHLDGTMIITADHGKAEHMMDNGQPRTAHTSNPVPFIVINNHCTPASLSLHELADIAPFILRMMNIPVPHEMKK